MRRKKKLKPFVVRDVPPDVLQAIIVSGDGSASAEERNAALRIVEKWKASK